MLRELRRAGSRFVATRSSSERAASAADLAERARRHFAHVEAVDDPAAALARAHELGEPVLVTGSLYLLGDLAQAERASGMARVTERLSVLAFAALLVGGDHRDRVRARLRDRQASAMTIAVPLAADLARRSRLDALPEPRDRPRRRPLARDRVLDVQGRAPPDRDPWLVALATLLGLFPPFLGPIIYMFFRPPEYIQDVRERELEIKAMEERLAQLDQRCPVCRAKVEASYLVCPVCTTRLRQACPSCGQPLESLWQVCPYCATEIPPGFPRSRTSRARELQRGN